MIYRDFQKELISKALDETDNVLIQADTGSGKTLIIAGIAKKYNNVLILSHRNLLVSQISRTLASINIKHNIIASKKTRRQCILNCRQINKENLIVNCNRYMCSIDSLISRIKRKEFTGDLNEKWIIIIDEAHHALLNNKYGKVLDNFNNKQVIGMTATPCRLDGGSLFSTHDSIFKKLIQAKSLTSDSVNTLIKSGILCDFKCYSIPEHINDINLKFGKNDYTYKSLEAETMKYLYKFIGDSVKNYIKHANNKQTVVFCINIDFAIETSEKFKEANISSAAIHSKMTQNEINRIFTLFEDGIIKVLCNVDIISEGIDVPAIEAIIMLRKTASLGLFRQWVGRSLRPSENKEQAIIIDHVGNIKTHGLPDKNISWQNASNKFNKNNLLSCQNCYRLNEAHLTCCVECGYDLRRALKYGSSADTKYINMQLVEIKREKIKTDIKNKTEISIPFYPDSGSIWESIHLMQKWCSEIFINQGMQIDKINDFFRNTDDQSFWINNFTLSDIDKNNHKKCMRVYKKWVK